MIGDSMTSRARLRQLDRWQSRLALCIIAAACILALMCEARASDMPPFKIADPLCQTGFTIAQRLDTRNAAGTIIKSVWVRKCTRTPRIFYGKFHNF